MALPSTESEGSGTAVLPSVMRAERARPGRLTIENSFQIVSQTSVDIVPYFIRFKFIQGNDIETAERTLVVASNVVQCCLMLSFRMKNHEYEVVLNVA